MPGPKRAAKIEAKLKRRQAQHENHHEPAQDLDADNLYPETLEETTSVDEEVLEDYEADNWDDMHKDKLKELAEERGLPTYGTKADIVKRIREHELD